ncbi:MAG: ATP-binding cassette domain-containing protein [Planctomycetota bacterium]
MSELALRTRDLRKVFHDPERGSVEALRGVDLECRYGEIYGLLGPNGAGKTTTLRILATILAPTSGEAELAGVDVARDPLEVRRRLGFLSASTGLYARLTPRETLRYFGTMHGLVGDALEQRIEELVETFEITAFADQRCQGLSSGQRQRVSIARAVLHDPTVLILDEPTTGLDILGTSDMMAFIDARRDAGRLILFSTHILSEAERLCDRIGVIHRGRFLGAGTLEELRERTQREYLDEIFRALVEEA